MDNICFNNNVYTYLEFVDSINNNKITLEEIKTYLTYDLLKLYGHHILNKYGNEVYDSIEFTIIETYIRNSSKMDIEKIISYYLLNNHKKTIIEVFGTDFFEKISEGYDC